MEVGGMNDKVKLVGIPAEPYGRTGDYGVVCRSDTGLRVTPARNGIPAMAYVHWNADAEASYFAWNRLVDIREVSVSKK